MATEIKNVSVELLNENNITTEQSPFLGDRSLIDPSNVNVEFQSTAGDFVNGEMCIVFSGPPTLKLAILNDANNVLKPIGLILNASIQQQKQFGSWDELGLSHSKSVPNKIGISLQMGRARTNYNSFSYAFYKWFIDLLNRSSIKEKALGLGETNNINRLEFVSYPSFVQQKVIGNNAKTKKMYDVSNKHWDNLRSEFFLFPFGLMILELDNYMNVVTSNYFENCKIPINSKLLNPDTFVVENEQILCSKMEPATGIDIPSFQRKIFKMSNALLDAFNEVKKDV